MNNNTNSNVTIHDQQTMHAASDAADEHMTTFVFGNIKIRDPDSNEVLVNLRF